jgi:hypothetical protein
MHIEVKSMIDSAGNISSPDWDLHGREGLGRFLNFIKKDLPWFRENLPIDEIIPVHDYPIFNMRMSPSDEAKQWFEEVCPVDDVIDYQDKDFSIGLYDDGI